MKNGIPHRNYSPYGWWVASYIVSAPGPLDLRHEGIQHGNIGESPAWSVSPYIAVWHIGGVRKPDSAGWWVISGDCPCDYVSAADADNPREAVRVIASLWQEKATFMAHG
jgi:hypothetical protein